MKIGFKKEVLLGKRSFESEIRSEAVTKNQLLETGKIDETDGGRILDGTRVPKGDAVLPPVRRPVDVDHRQVQNLGEPSVNHRSTGNGCSLVVISTALLIISPAA